MMYNYNKVQLQLHIIMCYHTCERMPHAKSCHVPRHGFACLTSTAMSNQHTSSVYIYSHACARIAINSI